MSSTRSIISPPPFAANALTVIPPTPVAGVSYRDPVAGPASSPDGWPYAERVNSAEFNQILFQMSSLMGIMDSQGILGWSSLVNYGVPSITFGSDGALYIALQASGPSTTVRDPVSSPAYWASIRRGIVRYTGAGTFVAPAGVYTIWGTGCAGGAGGGGSNSTSATSSAGGGGGGAGQSVYREQYSVTPGTSYAVSIGSAGAGGGLGAAGTNGGVTSVAGLVSLNGGIGGAGGGAASATNSNGGIGGAGFPGGSYGSDSGSALGAGSFGGAGASSPFGGGGRGTKGNGGAAVAGGPAFGFGSGGGGAGGVNGNVTAAGASGGAGAPGIFIIEY